MQAMSTFTNHQLDQMRSEWKALSHSRASRIAFQRLAQVSKPIECLRAQDLGDLISLLEPRAGLEAPERASIVSELLRFVGLDPLLTRALLQTLLPGLVGVARRLAWGRAAGLDPGAFMADLITLCFEVITEWGGQVRVYAAPDLLNAVRCRMRRQIACHHPTSPLDGDHSLARALCVAIEDAEPFDEIGARLKALGQDLDPIGAAGLYGREVLGYTYRELSSMMGVSPRMLAEASRRMAMRIL
jgi:hypothetical protein